MNRPPTETPIAPEVTPNDPLGINYREREKSITLESLTQQVERQREARRRDRPDGWAAKSQAETDLAPETELLTMNIGPHHPATHGVLRLLTTLEGEIVKSAEPLIGYVHTRI